MSGQTLRPSLVSIWKNYDRATDGRRCVLNRFMLRNGVGGLLWVCLFLGCAQSPKTVSSNRIDTKSSVEPVALPATLGIAERYQSELAALNGKTVYETLEAPYSLNIESIVKLIFQRNPSVRASREEMVAAKYGLEEFRANLSRLEPFVESRTDLSGFHNRRGAFGGAVESVVGVQNETFGGSIFSAEVGGSVSRFEFDRTTPTQDTVETGAGALVRARAEIPFLGSRRRQNRIIAQAFQETTARRAQLDYLEAYRRLVDSGLEYFALTVYNQRLSAVYQEAIDDLNELYNGDRVRPEDKSRVLSEKGGIETSRNLYQARLVQYQAILLSYVALDGDDDFSIDSESSSLSEFRGDSVDSIRLEGLIEKARENNPSFRVLNDAIRNTQLQRNQAIKGRYDLTTFIVGTLFPLGSETFDDRLDGWTVGGGVNVRLNDRRVLEATRLKAEAQIRQFEAEIEAEEIKMRRQITTETKGIEDNERNREKILEVAEQVRQEYEQRLEEYFDDRINIDQLLETRSELTRRGVNNAANLYNTANREINLMGATGRIYELAGLQIESSPVLDPR